MPVEIKHDHIGISMTHAVRGILTVAATERNFRVHLVAMVAVIAAGVWLQVSALEWVALILAMALVLVLEIVNTVTERVIDLVKPRMHPVVHDIKDMMAGSVLVSALAAATIGAIILFPKLYSILQPMFLQSA